MARPKAFETDQVLDAALQCFALQGFHATSIDDLVKCTGLSRASLYNAFGDKDGLFNSVLSRYELLQQAELRRQLASASSARQALRNLMVSAACAEQALGCLVVNSGMELAPSHPQLRRRVNRSMQGLRRMLKELVAQTGVRDVDAVASLLQVTFFGLRVLARTGTPRKQIHAIAEQAIEKLLPA